MLGVGTDRQFRHPAPLMETVFYQIQLEDNHHQ